MVEPRADSKASFLASNPPQPVTEQRWEVKRKHAVISTDLELLTFEVAKARKRCALSPATANTELTAEERQRLDTSHANKLKEAACKLCPAILRAVRAHKWAWPFIKPVDLERYKDYLRLVKEPMDLETISKKLEAWQYSSPQDFERDMRLIFGNCRSYNAPDQEVVVMGNTVESKFDEKWNAIIPARLVDIEVSLQAEEANMRQTHLLASHARAASELDNHWVHLAPHFAAMQAAIADAKAAAARMCKPLSYDGQVKLSTDLGQLAPEHFDRGMEALILARDEALEKHCEAIEDYDLHLSALDPATQHALQSYANACLRPRFKCHAHLWPGLVVGSGIKGIPASSRLRDAALTTASAAAPAAPATAAAPVTAIVTDAQPAARADVNGSGLAPLRVPQRPSAMSWPPPKPPLPPSRSLATTAHGVRMLVEQGSGIGQSEWARAGIPASAADAGGPQHSSPVIVLQLAPASGQATPAASIPLNAAQHTTSNTIIVPTPGLLISQARAIIPSGELPIVASNPHMPMALSPAEEPASSAAVPMDTAPDM